ncbi:MAG: hypothetical protein AB1716_23465, partial [Planctomycetota bacterium]
PSFVPAFAAPEMPSDARLALWSAHTGIGSFFTGLGWLLPVAVISFAAPGRHSVARRAGLKWGFYLVALPVWLGVGATAVYCAIWIIGMGSTHLAQIGALAEYEVRPAGFLPGLAALYGLWWARGVAAEPYLARRGPVVFLLHAALYAVAWIVLWQVLLSPAGLEGLL